MITEFNQVISRILAADSHCKMVKDFAGCSVKSADYDYPVTEETIEAVERYCEANSIPVTKIDVLIDVHMPHVAVRLLKKV